jgi:4-amino-4-deoxy-L-arabinose transferase-like glycosyltransferase
MSLNDPQPPADSRFYAPATQSAQPVRPTVGAARPLSKLALGSFLLIFVGGLIVAFAFPVLSDYLTVAALAMAIVAIVRDIRRRGMRGLGWAITTLVLGGLGLFIRLVGLLVFGAIGSSF